MRILMLLLVMVSLSGGFLLSQLQGAGWQGLLPMGLGLLAGASLALSGAVGVFRANADELVNSRHVSWLSSTRDYFSLRRMAHGLIRQASSTAIASAEVSHHADTMDQRLERQQHTLREASSSMAAITSAIEQVAASVGNVANLASRSREASHVSSESLSQVIEEMQALALRSKEVLKRHSVRSQKADSVRHVT